MLTNTACPSSAPALHARQGTHIQRLWCMQGLAAPHGFLGKIAAGDWLDCPVLPASLRSLRLSGGTTQAPRPHPKQARVS